MLSPFKWSDALPDLLQKLRFARHDSDEYEQAQAYLIRMAGQADAFALVISENVVVPYQLVPQPIKEEF